MHCHERQSQHKYTFICPNLPDTYHHTFSTVFISCFMFCIMHVECLSACIQHPSNICINTHNIVSVFWFFIFICAQLQLAATSQINNYSRHNQMNEGTTTTEVSERETARDRDRHSETKINDVRMLNIQPEAPKYHLS